VPHLPPGSVQSYLANEHEMRPRTVFYTVPACDSRVFLDVAASINEREMLNFTWNQLQIASFISRLEMVPFVPDVVRCHRPSAGRFAKQRASRGQPGGARTVRPALATPPGPPPAPPATPAPGEPVVVSAVVWRPQHAYRRLS